MYEIIDISPLFCRFRRLRRIDLSVIKAPYG